MTPIEKLERLRRNLVSTYDTGSALIAHLDPIIEELKQRDEMKPCPSCGKAVVVRHMDGYAIEAVRKVAEEMAAEGTTNTPYFAEWAARLRAALGVESSA